VKSVIVAIKLSNYHLLILSSHNCFPFRELEETTRTSPYYVDEDYPARPEV